MWVLLVKERDSIKQVTLSTSDLWTIIGIARGCMGVPAPPGQRKRN